MIGVGSIPQQDGVCKNLGRAASAPALTFVAGSSGSRYAINLTTDSGLYPVAGAAGGHYAVGSVRDATLTLVAGSTGGRYAIQS